MNSQTLKKNKFKNILILFTLTLTILLNASSCIAEEIVNLKIGNDYLLTTQKVVKNTVIKNPDILTLSPFFTIFNEKNVLILHPQKVGKTNITVCFEDKTATYEVVIKQEDKNPAPASFKKGDFEFIPLDAPPVIKESEEQIELDAPPVNGKGD